MAKPNWNPSPTDAMSLAALRWFACTLEAFAIDIYATDREAYGRIETVFRKALKDLGDIPIKEITGDDDCPDGYVRCGLFCKPACLADPAAASATPVRGAKSARKRRG